MAKFKLKKYEVIIDDGKDIFREYIPALSERDLTARWGGNGEFVRVKEIPDYLPSASVVADALKKQGFGQAECDIVSRILSHYVEGTGE